jgi:hypothetical protein
MFAGGAVAFGVAALVLSFVRRTRRARVRHIDVTEKKIPWAQEGDKRSQPRDVPLRDIGRKERRTEIYVNPVDIWSPTDLEKGLDRIPGPPTILGELNMVQDEETKSESVEDMYISPASTSGRAVCTYPGCTKSYAKQCDLKYVSIPLPFHLPETNMHLVNIQLITTSQRRVQHVPNPSQQPRISTAISTLCIRQRRNTIALSWDANTPR